MGVNIFIDTGVDTLLFAHLDIDKHIRCLTNMLVASFLF